MTFGAIRVSRVRSGEMSGTIVATAISMHLANDKEKDSRGDNQGKGKGKPSMFNGQCYSCGEYGHSARFCPHGAGKSKGKGKEQTICYTCGHSGHIAANCPKGKGKGAPVNWTNPGKGNTGQWNIGAVQPTTASASNQICNNQVDTSPLVWDASN